MVNCGPVWPPSGWRSRIGNSEGCWNATSRKAHPGWFLADVAGQATIGCRPSARRPRLDSSGSDHAWFEDRAPVCTLLVYVDDATGRLMQLLFVPSESTSAYFTATRA